MQTDTITLPSYWATALINNDYSGLEDNDPAEAERCRTVVAGLAADGWSIVDVDDSEPRFTSHYQLYDTGASVSGGEVLDYVMLRSAPARRRGKTAEG